MNSQIVELRRRLDESDSKNREITAKIGQLIALNPIPDTVNTAGDVNVASTNKRFRNIKPRSATVILKRVKPSDDNDDEPTSSNTILPPITVKRQKLGKK